MEAPAITVTASLFPGALPRPLPVGAFCRRRSPPPPRKKRGPNPDLLARLTHCENLLEEYEAARKQELHSSSSTREPSVGPKPIVPGKLVLGDGMVNFTDSPRWAALREELGAMRELVDVDHSKLSPPPPRRQPGRWTITGFRYRA
ncbi:hypothetical protein NW765_016902 [Fusarium oxysporum]|nr:hypothetical protein NW765_016902 [Fusarium oxysporum]KAJ4265177.1 hypothetical protein NW764_015738 [Fusarium oxysporum]